MTGPVAAKPFRLLGFGGIGGFIPPQRESVSLRGLATLPQTIVDLSLGGMQAPSQTEDINREDTLVAGRRPLEEGE
jgi:hypothetical protein